MRLKPEQLEGIRAAEAMHTRTSPTNRLNQDLVSAKVSQLRYHHRTGRKQHETESVWKQILHPYQIIRSLGGEGGNNIDIAKSVHTLQLLDTSESAWSMAKTIKAGSELGIKKCMTWLCVGVCGTGAYVRLMKSCHFKLPCSFEQSIKLCEKDVTKTSSLHNDRFVVLTEGKRRTNRLKHCMYTLYLHVLIRWLYRSHFPSHCIKVAQESTRTNHKWTLRFNIRFVTRMFGR